MKKLSEILGYDIIDIHSHFNHGVEGDVDRSGVQLGCHMESLEFLFEEYENIGIIAGGYSTYSSVLTYGRIPEENEYLHELAKNDPRIYQWVVIHPEQEETFRQARQMLGHEKVLGIKIHPYFHKYTITDYADKLFSFADEMGAIIVMHPDKIREMPKFCDKYPNMKLIIAHLGNNDFIDVVSESKHGNIYVDTSGGASYQNNIIERTVSIVGADKILFGTDTYSAAFQAGRIALARIDDDSKKKILHDNAVRLFPHAFKR